jgi:hydantoinase/carbamoylase family amidase
MIDDLRDLARIGATDSGGVTRRAFSRQYREATQWLADRMVSSGLSVRTDTVGNVIGRLGPPNGPVLLSGSHIDSVPEGGSLDGAYGVLAALECARILDESRIPMRCAFEVAAFVDEEGAYVSLLGSRAMAGTLAIDELAAAECDGETLRSAMAACGLELTRFEEARRRRDDIAAYIELHIEQGPVLERQNAPIGIVEGIVGVFLGEFTFTGRADHAGTTPMEARRDALRAAAAFMTAYYDAIERDVAVRATFGTIHALPGASNVVPRVARLTLDLRSLDPARIEERSRDARTIAERVGQQHRVGVELRRVSYDPPATMSNDVMEAIEASCADLGVSWLRMSSGAGHDAQSFATHWPTGMIFVPSRGGASHRPDEQTDEAELCAGANVLLRTVGRFCT